MCDGISLSWREFPDTLIQRHNLQRRVVSRAENGDREVRFLFRENQPVLPVWAGGQLWVWTWGRGKEPRLPSTGWCNQENLDAGRWSWLEPEPVEVPTSYIVHNGVWYQAVGGVRGMLVYDSQGMPHVYVLTQPSSHYYKVMTRCERMPVFLGSGI